MTMYNKLFFAIAPTPAQKNLLMKFQQCGAHLRQVNPDNLHMTLLYLGPCSDSISAKLITTIDGHQWPKFTVNFDHIDYWHKPKIICVVASAIDVRLASLVDKLTVQCAKLGFDAPKLAFNPHITILRKVRQPLGIPTQFDALLPLSIDATSLNLYHSYSSPNGVQYDLVKAWPLH